VDLVYICRSGENEELRYSLRSVYANAPYDRVFIFGDKPEWVSDEAIFVPVEQVVPTPDENGSKWLNETNSLGHSCSHPDVSDPFVLMNDDFFFCEPTDSIPVLHAGPVWYVISEYRRLGRAGPFFEQICNLERLVQNRDYLSYEIHVPIMYHKEGVRRVLEFVKDYPEVNSQTRSLYGNANQVGGEVSKDPKIYGDEPIEPVNGFLSCHDNTFGRVRPFLDGLFPSPSPFEKSL
jgi:hypothetical protein